ncbi:MAG: KEOPS complex kinase/ATPase Bud32 [Candidatus Hydrothermarchaeales archaeon]
MTFIKRGAEAVITIKDGTVLKDRVKKSYREEHLDGALRKGRTKKEAKLMALAKRAGVPTPFITDVDVSEGSIEMSHVRGERIKDILNETASPKRKEICRTIGEQVGRLHKNHIIHGDLTTSNMILSQVRVYFIDFGLGEINESVEAKGVDLLLFKKALHSAHWKVAEECFTAMVEGYKEEYQKAEAVLERLKVIERRGRYFSER